MQELSDKLRRGLQLAEQRLLERNARHGKLLSQGTPDCRSKKKRKVKSRKKNN